MHCLILLYFRQMDAGDDETAAGTRRCSLSCQVWLWKGQMQKQQVQLSKGGSHLHRSMQLQQRRDGGSV